MNPEIFEQKMHQENTLSSHQRRCMQDLIVKLKEITLKIEELDEQEDKIGGDSPGARDQLRAINISRIVYVNQQKDLEEQLSDIINSCPPEPPMEKAEEICLDDDLEIIPVASVPELQRESDILEQEHSGSSPEPSPEYSSQPSRDPFPEPSPSQPKEAAPSQTQEPGVKKPRFKFNVLSFIICPTCDARLPANFRTCGRCGTKLQNFCPHCSAAVPGGVAFCGKCGKRIS